MVSIENRRRNHCPYNIMCVELISADSVLSFVAINVCFFVYSLIIKCYIMWYFACVNGRVLRSCYCGLEIIVFFIFQVIVLLVSVLVLLLMIFLN